MQQPAAITEAGAPRVEPGAAEWLSPARFALLLGAFIFAAFPQVLLGLQTFVVRDFGFFAYPLAHYQRECFWRGELPFWNPYNNCGVPFLAQWNTMTLYPPALIYLLLPLRWSLSFFCLLHLFWAGLGMYGLAQRWTGNRVAAAVAGVVFAFNGLSLNLLMWPSHIATLSWMPWVVWSVERAWQEGGRKLFWAALAGALQMLAGGPETILFTWLILLALWGVECIVQNPRSKVQSQQSEDQSPERKIQGPQFYRMLWRFPVVVLLVAGLAAVQLLPFLDLAAHSQRGQGYADSRWAMPGWGWVNFLVPMAFGSRWRKGVFFQYGQSWTSSYYIGVGALLLALAAVWTVRNRRVRLLAAAAGAALLLAMGGQTFVYRGLRQLLPQLSLMTYPVKFVTVAVFAAPLLAGFGVARVQQHRPGQRPGIDRELAVLGALLLGLVAAVLLWAWRFRFPADDFPATLRNGLSRAAFLAAVVVLLIALRRSRRPEAILAVAGCRRSAPWTCSEWRWIVPVLLLAVLWLDVWTHEPPQNPCVPAWIYAPGLARTRLRMDPQPALGQSRAMVAPAAEVKFTGFILSDPKDNLLVKRLGYFADCNLLDGVPKVNGFFSLYPRAAGELNSVLYASTNADFPRLADFMGVSQTTAPTNYFEWTPRDTFQPLATAGQRPVFLDDTNALRALLARNFDGRRIVVLPLESRALVSVTNPVEARVVAQRFEPERVELEVEAAEPALVVVAQTYYHRWRALVDGRAARLLRANYAFQAVEVPAGRHQVRLVYEDGAFRIGAAISGLTLLGCAAGWTRKPKRRRKQPGVHVCF